MDSICNYPSLPLAPYPKEEKHSGVRHSNRKPLFHIAQSSQLTPTHPTPKTAGAQGQTPSWAPPAYPQSRSLLPPRPSYPSRGSSRQTPSYSRRLCLHRQHLHCPLLWSLRHRSDTAAAAWRRWRRSSPRTARSAACPPGRPPPRRSGSRRRWRLSFYASAVQRLPPHCFHDHVHGKIHRRCRPHAPSSSRSGARTAGSSSWRCPCPGGARAPRAPRAPAASATPWTGWQAATGSRGRGWRTPTPWRAPRSGRGWCPCRCRRWWGRVSVWERKPRGSHRLMMMMMMMMILIDVVAGARQTWTSDIPIPHRPRTPTSRPCSRGTSSGSWAGSGRHRRRRGASWSTCRHRPAVWSQQDVLGPKMRKEMTLSESPGSRRRLYIWGALQSLAPTLPLALLLLARGRAWWLPGRGSCSLWRVVSWCCCW